MSKRLTFLRASGVGGRVPAWKTLLLISALPLLACHPAFADPAAHQAVAIKYAKSVPLTDVIDEMLPCFVRNVPVRERRRVAEEVRKRLDQARIMQTHVEILMSIYSTEELDALAAFYSSPVGRSIHSKRWQVPDNHWRFREEVERAVKQAQDELAVEATK